MASLPSREKSPPLKNNVSFSILEWAPIGAVHPPSRVFKNVRSILAHNLVFSQLIFFKYGLFHY